MSRDLPSYARPLFVRVMKGMDTTSTHKLQKVKARQEGFDIQVTTVCSLEILHDVRDAHMAVIGQILLAR